MAGLETFMMHDAFASLASVAWEHPAVFLLASDNGCHGVAPYHSGGAPATIALHTTAAEL